MTEPSDDFDIPRVIDTLEQVDQPTLRPFYKQGDDGKFHLRLRANEPDVERKLAEFRENNRSLNSQKTELEEKLKAFEGIDPTEYQTLKSRLAELEGTAVDAEKVRAAEAALEAERAARNEDRLRHVATLEFLRAGGHPDAANLFATEAAKHLKVTAAGEVVGKAPGQTVAAWVAEASQKSLSFLFRPSKGGGTTKSDTPPGDHRPVINRDDPLAFGENLERIATGKAVVR